MYSQNPWFMATEMFVLWLTSCSSTQNNMLNMYTHVHTYVVFKNVAGSYITKADKKIHIYNIYVFYIFFRRYFNFWNYNIGPWCRATVAIHPRKLSSVVEPVKLSRFLILATSDFRISVTATLSSWARLNMSVPFWSQFDETVSAEIYGLN
jgi:hypothetical protein